MYTADNTAEPYTGYTAEHALRPMTRRALSRASMIFVVSLALSHMIAGCHMIPSDDEPLTELSSPRGGNLSPPPSPCTLSAPQGESAQPSLFTAWWEGEWALAEDPITEQISTLTQGSKHTYQRSDLAQISASLTQAFTLKIHPQHAQLTIDGRSVKLASSPLSGDSGLRLIGAQRELFMWCEGDQVYWRVESGERFSLRRITR